MTKNSIITLWNLEDAADAAEVDRLHSEGYSYIDTYEEQLKELAEIRDPKSVGSQPASLTGSSGDFAVEIPWSKTLVRIVGKDAYWELRTNRNRDLLTREEQERFASARIGFAGLNVGNPGAVCIALEGGARAMKLADLDPLSLTNLNRFRAGLGELGVNKATLTARQILEIDPYYELEMHEKGIAPDTLTDFLSEPKLDLLVEEMDALPLKIKIREEAKRLGVPVIMVTGNAEGVLLDVERYDQDRNTPLFNSLIRDEVLNAITGATKALAPHEKVALARDFMGAEYLDPRLVDSFSKFGTELVGIPQLAESSFMRGAALCYAAKAIILSRPLPSGRYSFSFSDNLTPVKL